jgi:Tfp pilus assembly protein PilO
MRISSLSPRVHSALAVVALLAVAVVAYLVLIAPKRSAAAELADQIDETQAQIDARRARARVSSTPPQVDVAEVFRTTKAMPDETGMPDLILELNRIASDSGVSFASIAPGAPVEATGYRAIPLALVADGTYFGVSRFLARIRQRVRLDGGRLKASGRLLTVESVSLAQDTERFPRVQASLTVNALVYGGGAATESGTSANAASTTEESSNEPAAADSAGTSEGES